MLAVALILGLGALGALGLRHWLAWLRPLDPAEASGVAGLLFLGAIGWLMFPIGLLGGARLGPWVLGLGALTLAGSAVLAKRWRWESAGVPPGPAMLAPLGLAVLALVPLFGVLAPPDELEWDSLAYHLAVPKLWLTDAAMRPVASIHQSFFPFAIDNLFVIGLAAGSEVAAKAFSFAVFVFGLLAVFGGARRWFGQAAGWWASLGFAGVPLVLWQSGTAYIDVGHGLFAALGALYAADHLRNTDAAARRRFLLLAGCCLGLAAASKYTGLQAVAAVGLVLGIGLLTQTRRVSAALVPPLLVAGLALSIASPWYIRNAVVTGNPVYPFFYGTLGGKYWSEWRADVYRNEQQTFGVGRTEAGRDLTQAPHAMLGLAYQPGRYINPGQERGRGFPFGAIGAALIAGGLVATSAWRRLPGAAPVLGVILVSLGMWFFLSQQSRYILSLAPLLAILVGGAIARLSAGPLLGALVVAQAAYSFWLLRTLVMDAQAPVVLGRISRDAWLRQRVGFAEAAEAINRTPGVSRVALFDEVFGYLLDVPYLWANPAHSNLVNVPPDGSDRAFLANLRELGCSHVYWSWQFLSGEQRRDMLRKIRSGVRPPPAEGLIAADGWRPLLLQASANGRLRLVGVWRSGALFEIAP